ncbi:MAG: hypothetical protein ACKVKY_01085 [Burkholderiales bacterium]|jgi:uncharacterized protein|tara:strand:+ start:16051 stop:16368 length:318 start_codon:yes stop_codon:yes gene_type:complete
MKFLFLSCFFVFSFGGGAHAAINCSNPTGGVERLICTSSRASVSQEDLAFSYNLAMRRGVDMKLLQQSQTDWYNNVLSRCNNVTCAVDAMAERSAEIENMDGKSD